VDISPDLENGNMNDAEGPDQEQPTGELQQTYTDD
jgi:hypothetical protein